MAKRVTSKKTSKSGLARAPTRPAAKAGRAAVAKTTGKSKTARVPARAKPVAKAAARKGPATATATKSKTAPAKKAAGKRSRKSRIDVKVGSFGGQKPGSFGFNGHGKGLSFLTGKPGSVGSGGSDGDRPRLTRTKLTPRELRHFRDLLLTKRRQLLGDMDSMENEALRVDSTNLSHLPVHMADMGTDNYEQEFTLSLVDRERKLLDEIDAALRKIDDKTYGICEGTGQMISIDRLEAQPWARYGIEYARHLQRPGYRRPVIERRTSSMPQD